MNQTVGKIWYVKRCAAGTAICLAAYVLFLALFSYLTVRGVVAEEQMQVLVWVGAAVSDLLGTALCSRKTAKRSAVILISAAGFYLAVLLLGFLTGDTLKSTGALQLLIPVAAGTVCSVLMGGNIKKAKKRAKRASGIRK